MKSLFMESDALLSDCGKFRYWLSRIWDREKPSVCFVMLNPSAATATQDDPTIRRCFGFAIRLGCGQLMVCNLFAYRATNPHDLRRAGYPVGPENDDWIRQCVAGRRMTIAAWGAQAGPPVRDRIAQVRRLLREIGLPICCLGTTKDGSPRHPLFVPSAADLQEYQP